MSLCGRIVVLSRILWLVFILLSISLCALADEKASEKPEDWQRRLENLRSVPYVAYSETAVDERKTGVVLYDPEKAYDGYNFYCTKSSGEAFLLDMDGRPVHRWTHFGEQTSSEDHALMLENGDLVVIKEYQKLLRLDWNSELIWKRDLAAHHGVALASDGSIYVIALEERVHRGLKVGFDAVVHLSADGEGIDRWSTYDHLDELKKTLDPRSLLDTVLDQIGGGRRQSLGDTTTGRKRGGQGRYDYFHMNTVSVLPGTVLGSKDSRFRGGNLLVCFRNVNQIGVLQKDTYRVLWSWGEGELEWPHHSTMLENGHILIFDNGVRRQYSRVVELDPVVKAIVWEHVAEPREDFYSYTRGSAQRLPNGNTLISESDNGRVFEVTPDGEVVWRWLNPETREGRPKIVYRMLRLPLAQGDTLLERWD